MRNGAHTAKLGQVAEDLAVIKLSTIFEDCIVSQVVNNQLHDVEIRKKGEERIDGICRIQVTATNSKGQRGNSQFYGIGLHHARFGAASGKVQYEPGDADFFLFYIFPEAKFYVTPEAAVKGKYGMNVYVGLPKPKNAHAGKYEEYLEAWGLIAAFLGINLR